MKRRRLSRREFMLAASSRPKAGSGSPNLRFVSGDQIRFDACGFTGNRKARTPNIDRLATEGTRFSKAVSSTPVCAPFHASLMTGKYTTTGRRTVSSFEVPEAVHTIWGA